MKYFALITLSSLSISNLCLAQQMSPWQKFCAAPYAAVCGNSQQEGLARRERIQRVENDLQKPALLAAYQFLNGNQNMPDSYDELDIKNTTPKALRQKAIKIFFAELRHQLRMYLAANKVPSDLQIPIIKEALLTAIDRSSEITENIRKDMQNSVRETHLVSITDLNSEDMANTTRDIMEIYHGCSKNMFTDNAFASQYSHQKVIVICPGEIIGSVEFAKDAGLPANLSAAPLFMTLAHEMGHHFDYTVFPEAYPGLMQKLGKANSYGAEITADIWSLKAFRVASEKMPDIPEKVTLVRGAMNDLCGTLDDQEHPDGRFRIEVLSQNYLCQ